VRKAPERVLIIGSGSIAQRHMRNLGSQFPSAVVVCVSSTGRSLEKSEVPATEISASIEDALNIPPDFAIVASPANLHLEHALKILMRGIPVLVEKPLCISLADDPYRLLLEGREKIGVGYNLRFLPSAQVVKNLLEKKELGDITAAFAEVGQYLPDWRPGVDYKSGVSGQKKLGGGALLELSHELDYLQWIFGNFTQLMGTTRNSGQLGIDVEDNVDAMLITDQGGVVHVHLDFLQRAPSRTFKAVGDKATLLWDILRNEVSLLLPGGERRLIYSDPGYDRNQMYTDQLNAFVDFAFGYGRFDSSFESAERVMGLVDAIRASDSSRKWIAIEERQ
jgi:predicted dehydrogenase